MSHSSNCCWSGSGASILLLDGDAAGRRATDEIATRLRSHCCLQAITLPADMQPDQMSRDHIWHVLRAGRDPGPAPGSIP